MQMDVGRVESACLEQLIYRHDYKDNHDVDESY